MAAWVVFRDAQEDPSCWAWLVGLGGALPVGLKNSELESVARAHNFAWDSELRDRIKDCQRWLLADMERKRKKTPAPSDTETVN